MLRFAREPFVLFRRSSGLLTVHKKSTTTQRWPFLGEKKATPTKVKARSVLPRAGEELRVWLERRLCGAAEVCVYADLPLIKQPFWDVAPVPVLFAPFAQLGRDDILFR